MLDNHNILYKELSHRIIGLCFKVHSTLGSCLPEYVYESSLAIEFDRAAIPYTRQQRHDVYYEGVHVGHFVSDMVVNRQIILEHKSDDSITGGHIAQLLTYLRITGLRIGYVINFGTKSLQFKRLLL